jgi:hypothetical protein
MIARAEFLVLLNLALTVIVVVTSIWTLTAVVHAKSTGSTESFCNCSGMQCNSFNQNRRELQRLYSEGKLTEFNFPQRNKHSLKYCSGL